MAGAPADSTYAKRPAPKKRVFVQSPEDSAAEALDRVLDARGYSGTPNVAPKPKPQAAPQRPMPFNRKRLYAEKLKREQAQITEDLENRMFGGPDDERASVKRERLEKVSPPAGRLGPYPKKRSAIKGGVVTGKRSPYGNA